MVRHFSGISRRSRHFPTRTAIVAAGLCLLAGGAAQAQPAMRSCAVAALQGEAAVERAADRLPVRPGVALAAGDRLASAADSRVQIRCSDGVAIHLGAGTVVDVGDLTGPAAASRNVVLRLIDGIVRVALPTLRSWRSFEVQTPTAVASVRSTDWIVKTDRAGATEIFVVAGRVLAADRKGTQGAYLEAGDGIDFAADGTMKSSVRWGKPRVERTLAAVAPR